jgi:hypothetical protein
MSFENVRRRLAPFRPFILRTSDGLEYPILHRNAILVGQSGISVIDADGEIVSVNPLHLVAVKELPAQRNRRKRA